MARGSKTSRQAAIAGVLVLLLGLAVAPASSRWTLPDQPSAGSRPSAVSGQRSAVSHQPLASPFHPSPFILHPSSFILDPPSADSRPPSIVDRRSSKDCLASGCHAPLAKPKYLHGPMAVNACGRCHEETDRQNHKYRLVAQPPELCFACHEKLQAKLADPKTRPHHHKPVSEGKCLDCHDPHGSGHPLMLKKASVVDLCMGCHKDKISLEGRLHKPIEEKGCLECHRGHQSRSPKLLPQPSGDLCLRCHKDKHALFTSMPYVHPPVRDKECTACHTPHASTHGRLLVEPFAADLYVPYDDGESFALCFQCHDVELLEDEETDEYTDFRNGERNLHYLHVNKASKGRSCRICHDPHAGNQPRLLRSMVPYGKWQLRIRFVPTETGGYCGPACHPAKRYDRLEPVDWDQEPVPPSPNDGKTPASSVAPASSRWDSQARCPCSTDSQARCPCHNFFDRLQPARA